MLLGLDHHQRGRLAEDESVAVAVERTAGAGRVVVVRRQHDPHLGEAGDRHRLDLGLHATADGDVGLAVDDVAPGVGDRLRSRRAGRDRGRHTGFGAAIQTDNGGRAVGHVHLNDQRRHRTEAPGPHAVIGEHEFLGRAESGADRHHQPAGVDIRRAGVLPHPTAHHSSHLLEVGVAPLLDPVQLGLEVLQQVSADADGQVVLLNERIVQETDSALPVQQFLPRVLGIHGQCRRSRHASDDDVRKAVTGCQLSHRRREFSTARRRARRCVRRIRRSC